MAAALVATFPPGREWTGPEPEFHSVVTMASSWKKRTASRKQERPDGGPRTAVLQPVQKHMVLATVLSDLRQR